MIRIIPMVEWEKALYQVFKKHIVGYEIYNTIAPIFELDSMGLLSLPEQWVEIGSYTCSPSSAKKDIADFRVTSIIHAYCKGQSKQKLNEMLNDIVTSASAGLELEEYMLEEFQCHDVNIGLIEAFEVDFENGEAGQHGVVQIIANLQQKEV